MCGKRRQLLRDLGCVIDVESMQLSRRCGMSSTTGHFSSCNRHKSSSGSLNALDSATATASILKEIGQRAPW